MKNKNNGINALLLITILFLSNGAEARATYHFTVLDDPSGVVKATVLTDEKSQCGSTYQRAFTANKVLDEWKVQKELCYKIGYQKNMVEINDPSKWVLKNYSLSASKFIRIPTEAEVAAAKESEQRRIIAERRLQMNQIYNSVQNRRPLSGPDPMADGPRPMIINGEMVLCNKIGFITNCD